MKIKMVQYGCGKMAEYTIRYAMEKGVKVIGCFDIDNSKIGKDVMSVYGKEPIGVKIQHANDFENFLQQNEVDVVIVTTMSLLKDVYDALEICARNGVNAITTCEEALFPQNSNPRLFKKLQNLAMDNDCTICGSGYQDVFWGNLITVLAGATHTIKKIHGKSSYNVEDYGIALARAHGAGLTVKEFEEQIASSNNISGEDRAKLIMSGEFSPSYMWNVNGWLSAQMCLTVVNQTQKCIPQIAKEDIYSDTLKMTIKKGDCTGMSAVVTTTTKEGVTIQSECIGKVYAKDEFDCNDWTIEGEPTTRVTIERPSTVELTCATVINRIPEVLDAPAGYFSTEKLPSNFFKARNLDKYLYFGHCDEDCDCDGNCDCDEDCGDDGCDYCDEDCDCCERYFYSDDNNDNE